MKTDGKGLSTDENWPVGDNMVINPYMSEGRVPLHGITTITTITSVPSETFKNAVLKMCYCLLEGHTEEELWTCFESSNWAAPVPKVLHSQHLTPQTTRQWNHPQSRPPQHTHIRSTVPFRKCFKSCSPMSDIVTRYGPQATTRFTCIVLVQFEHEPSKTECR